MEEEFRALLLAASGVTALVSTRVDWAAHVQGEPWPALVLHKISATTTYTYSGPDDLQQGRVQVDCIALTYLGAKTLSRAVLAALSGTRGGRFQGIFHALSREDRLGDSNAAERPFRVSLDFTTNWR